MGHDAAIELTDDGITVDAAIVAEGLGIEPAAVQAGMRQGAITSRCERGIGRHAGRYRLTFFHGGRRLRLVLDEGCNILGRAVTDLARSRRPASRQEKA